MLWLYQTTETFDDSWASWIDISHLSLKAGRRICNGTLVPIQSGHCMYGEGRPIYYPADPQVRGYVSEKGWPKAVVVS